MAMRLDRILTHSGYGTRKEVKGLIRQGYVQINGVVIRKDDFKVDQNKDIIVVDGIELDYREFVYLMMNKPAGYICATEDQKHQTVIDLISEFPYYNLFPVGRLDKDTTGLLLISNDGRLAHKIISPNSGFNKNYLAWVNGKIDQTIIDKFNTGVVIDTGYTCKPAQLFLKEVDKEGNSLVEVIIYEGKFHQIKKMFASCGLKVLNLHRYKIKNLVLDQDLAEGQYRELNPEEIIDFKESL